MKSRFFPLLMTFVVFILLYLFAYSQYSSFGSMRVVCNLLRNYAYLGIPAVGVTFVILSGGIDLSPGSVIAFTGVFCALMIERQGMHPLVAFAAILAIATVFGSMIGVLIYYFKIPSFIATLSGMFLARGGAYVLTTDSISIRHPFYVDISNIVYVFPDGGRFTFAAGAFVVVVLIGIFLAHYTHFGRNVYAIGGNETGAAMLGVPVARTIIGIYALSSFLSAFAGIILSLSKRSGDSTIALGAEMDVIAAVVIGGTLLTGGVGYVVGTFIGVLLPGVIHTYLTLDGSLTPWWIKIIVGALFLGFILMQKLLSSRADFARPLRSLRRAEEQQQPV
ncbi:MAG: sugar ABC transporter permease YjfF [Chloroflexi bacterium]|nr:sugar ABC transporter permease YjfF [Chloroflexota bacterium]